MKQAMMQRYLDFMAMEIRIQKYYYELYSHLLITARGTINSPVNKKEVIKLLDKIKYRENNMSYIQTQVKRAIAGTGEITQAVAQGMEKQVIKIIKNNARGREWVKNNKFDYSKADYIATCNQYKSRLTRLVELQQAIRKEKQKGKYE